MEYWEINIEREIWETIIKSYKEKKKKEDRKCCWGFREREREREREGMTFFWGVVERERDLGFSTKNTTQHPHTHHNTPHHRLRVLCSSGWHWVWFCCFCFSKISFLSFLSISLFLFFPPFCFWVFFFGDFFFFFSLSRHHKCTATRGFFFTFQISLLLLLITTFSWDSFITFRYNFLILVYGRK